MFLSFFRFFLFSSLIYTYSFCRGPKAEDLGPYGLAANCLNELEALVRGFLSPALPNHEFKFLRVMIDNDLFLDPPKVRGREFDAESFDVVDVGDRTVLVCYARRAGKVYVTNSVGMSAANLFFFLPI